MLNFSLVDVKSITSDVPRSDFVEADIDNLADMILETGGIIRPLVVKMTGAESYTVVDGDFEYYAAVRSREKDPRKGEMVNAFIISPKSEQIVKKQAEAMGGFKVTGEKITSNTIELRLANLEGRLEKQINEFRSEQAQERQKLEDRFKQIESRNPQQVEALKLINTLNKDELAIRLHRSRISGAEKIAKAIVDARKKKQKQEFEDYRDVVNSVKGLGEKTILTMIDDWSKN
jgi:hypothetical protein